MVLYAIKFWDIVSESWKYHYCKNLKQVAEYTRYLIEITSDYQIFSLEWTLESSWSFDAEDYE